tara:strand:- start:294 stop:527 length:234 start_codon:yes stop_codon:yes gene_type:complete
MKPKTWKLSRAHILLIETMNQAHQREINQTVSAVAGYQKEQSMNLLSSFRDDLKIPAGVKVGFDGKQFEEVNGSDAE